MENFNKIFNGKMKNEKTPFQKLTQIITDGNIFRLFGVA
jgi:hypothetical protein